MQNLVEFYAQLLSDATNSWRARCFPDTV